MLKKAISYGIVLISAGIGIGIAVSFRDIVNLHRFKIGAKHQENVNKQRIMLFNEITKKGETNHEEAATYVKEQLSVDKGD